MVIERGVTTAEVADLALFAEEMGYSYNKFIDLLEESRIIPFYEAPYKELYSGAGEDYGWSKEVTEVVEAFVKEYGDVHLLRG